MAFPDQGFNFRNTAGYVTDGANETYVIAGDTYPTTRDSETFGWDTNVQERDRDSAVDRRLAGTHFVDSGSGTSKFRVDLPAAGDYEISLALGDRYFTLVGDINVLDDSTELFGIAYTMSAAQRWFDAQDTELTQTTWPSSHATRTETFSSTIFFIEHIYAASPATDSPIGHLFLSQVATVVPYPRHRHYRQHVRM